MAVAVAEVHDRLPGHLECAGAGVANQQRHGAADPAQPIVVLDVRSVHEQCVAGQRGEVDSGGTAKQVACAGSVAYSTSSWNGSSVGPSTTTSVHA